MSALNLFIPITKVDAAKRLVYGTLTEEVPDKSGEIIDYESTKTAYQKWSDEAYDRSGGKSKGNLRAMHANIAAGKFNEIIFDDEARRIQGVAYVSDDNEWKKVEDGTYTGFSHGGKYAKRWKDQDNPALTRYTPELAEVSLVDNPCVPTATFEFIKEDGSTELRKFNAKQEDSMTDDTKTTADTEKSAPAGETAAGAASETATEALEKSTSTEGQATTAEDKTAAETSERPQDKGGVVQGFMAKDGSFHVKKADALKRNTEVDAQVVAAPALEALKKLDEAVTKAEGKDEDAAAEKPADAGNADKVEKAAETTPSSGTKGKDAAEPAAKAAPAKKLKKGLGEVARMACLIQELDWFQSCLEMEADWERDNSPLPAELKQHIAGLCQFLRALVEEETAELFDDGDAVEVEILEMAAGLPAGHAEALHKLVGGFRPDADKESPIVKKLIALRAALQKAGARHSKADMEHLKAIHGHAGEIMERCMKMGMATDEDGEDEKDGAEKLTKVTTERDALQKVLGDLTPQIETLTKRIEHLEKQPMPPKGALRAVEKGTDGGNVSDGDDVTKIQELTKGKSPEEVGMLLMKAALRNPKAVQ